MLSLLMAILIAQGATTVSVGKSEAAPYRLAVASYKKAKESFERGDLNAARALLDEILGNPLIEANRRECLLKIQNGDATWSPPGEFYPSLLRAKVRAAHAERLERAGDAAAGQANLRAAADDAAVAVARGVPGAAELKREIDGRLQPELEPPGEGVRIPRTHAERYRNAARRLADAREALKSGDPARALALAESVLEDPEILPQFIGPVLILGVGPGGTEERVKLDPQLVRATAALEIAERGLVDARSQLARAREEATELKRRITLLEAGLRRRPVGPFGAWPPVIAVTLFVLGGLWWVGRRR